MSGRLLLLSVVIGIVLSISCCVSDHWQALSKLIDLMRRAGQLEECAEFLKKAEQNNPNARMQAGFNYCKGLHLWSVYLSGPH